MSLSEHPTVSPNGQMNEGSVPFLALGDPVPVFVTASNRICSHHKDGTLCRSTRYLGGASYGYNVSYLECHKIKTDNIGYPSQRAAISANVMSSLVCLSCRSNPKWLILCLMSKTASDMIWNKLCLLPCLSLWFDFTAWLKGLWYNWTIF